MYITSAGKILFNILLIIPSGKFAGSWYGLTLEFAAGSSEFSSKGIDGFEGILISEAAAKIKLPVTK